MRILQIVFLLSVCGCSQARNLTTSNILEIAKLSKDVTIDLFKTFKLLNEDFGQSSKANGQRVLYEEIKIFKNKIDMFSAKMGTIPLASDILHAMIVFIDKQPELRLRLLEAIKKIDFIELKYQHMGNFVEDFTLDDYAKADVSNTDRSSQSSLDRIHDLIGPQPNGSVFEFLNEIMKVQGNQMFCNVQMSEQQLLLDLYNTVALIDLKSFLMVVLSNMLLKSHNKNETYIEITEQGINSDRFNMRSSESDIDHNKVVTGLRFVKKNRIIHLQIQQGKLLPNAQINVTTVNWKPVEDYKIDDGGVLDGRDYHTLTLEKRNFDLDDLVTKEEELLTGVRFGMIGSHLNFQIRLTPFNFTTGTLEVGKSKWKHNEVSEKNRKKVNLDNKDIPIRPLNHSLPVSKSGMYLEFTPTDVSKDLAQTTVPFIDAQAVASAKPVPLSGAGVMYKGSKNSVGFIGPKIMTYDYSELLLNAELDYYCFFHHNL